MRPLILPALLLVSTAIGGGVGPYPASSLEHGQVWQLTATRKDGLSVILQVKLGKQISTDASGQTYAAEGLIGGGSITFSPRERGIDASIMELNSLRCFARFAAGSDVAQGYLLYGSVEWNNERLRKAQVGTDFSRRSLLRGLGPRSDGTCTLQRLR